MYVANQILEKLREAKPFFIATFYSAITFCVLSYISVMASLLSSVGNLIQKPVANLGFPYHYYYQFWLNGSDSPNCGWSFKNFVIDFLLTWLLVTIIYLTVKRNK